MQHKIHLEPSEAVVLVSGGSGLIGTALAKRLAAAGAEVRILGRSTAGAPKSGGEQSGKTAKTGRIRYFSWNPSAGTVDREALPNLTHLVNLAGAGIADKPWTLSRKSELWSSRTQSTEFLRKTLLDQGMQEGGLRSIVTASAVGYYRTGEELATETSPRGQGFLAELTEAWEQSSGKLAALGPLTTLRIGLVLSGQGGLLGPLLPVTKLGLGAAMGTGRQWMSWIHMDDLVELTVHALFHPGWQAGTYNAVAPLPRRHLSFMRCLASSLHRPLWLAVPAWPLRLAMGERSSLILEGVKASSQKVQDAGFVFQHPDLEGALHRLFQK